MSTTVLKVNSEQAQRIIKLCWKAQMIAKANKIPVTTGVALVGAPQTSKSSLIRSIVEKCGDGYGYWMAALATLMDSGDLGTPVPDVKAQIMRYFTAGHWPFNSPEAKGIFAFEELDRCPVELQRGAAHIMLERELHGMKLGDGVFCCATMNGTSDTYTEELSEHIRTRMVTVFVQPDQDTYDAWAADHGLSTTRRAFNRYHHDAIKQDHEWPEMAVCGNRTLDMADCILQSCKVVKFRTDDIIMPAIAGCIGVGAAARYMATDKLVSEAPDPEECITSPDTAKVPENVTTAYSLALAIAGAVATTADRDRLTGAATYLARMQPALAAVAFKTVSDKNPRIWTTKQALGWQNDHKALLL